MAFILLQNSLDAQNLIPNSSFEEYSKCPTGLKQLEYAVGWKRANAGTPELFNSCGFSRNFSGNSGDGYAGVILLTDYASIVEYIQVELLDTLKADKNYCLSYYIRLDKESPVAINKIGAYFSNTRLYTPVWQPFRVTPQLVNNKVIDNTTAWQQVKSSFKAKGGEKFLTIGNYFEKHYLSEKGMNNTVKDWTVYYYFDDFELNEVAANCSSLNRPIEPLMTGVRKWRHTVYFNKDSSEFTISQNKQLEVFMNTIPKPLLQAVKLEGHTDKDASFEYNHYLSQRRAEKVKELMVNFGFNNVYVTWFGEKSPKNEGLNFSEKALNRRVEISIEQ